MTLDKFDVCIVGAGAVGLAIAYQLATQNRPGKRSIVVLERESSFGQHTSSRNSEVIHAGIYYARQSLKAELCVRGKQLLYPHCQRFEVPFRKIGKFIVAQTDQEQQLQDLADNAAANGVDDLQWFSKAQLAVEEPVIRASSALYSPSTGIFDCHSYMQSLLHLAQAKGVQFAPLTTVTGVEPGQDEYVVECSIQTRRGTDNYCFRTAALINSAGLYAQKLASLVGGLNQSVVPPLYLCKGDYFSFVGTNPINHLIYPLPERNEASLGIHATLDLGGQLRFGPDFEYVDNIGYKIDPDKATQFAHAITNYFPAIDAGSLLPGYSGIRSKLAPRGSPAQDFCIQDGSLYDMPGLVQLFGIESPGLTASLAIGEYVNKVVSDYLG